MTVKVRLMLVDDSPLIRKGLRLLMRGQPDIDVVGEAENGVAAVELSRSLRPDVILMDIRMPGLNGVTANEQDSGGTPCHPGRHLFELAEPAAERRGARRRRVRMPGEVGRDRPPVCHHPLGCVLRAGRLRFRPSILQTPRIAAHRAAIFLRRANAGSRAPETRGFSWLSGRPTV